ncbi:MULTISPECIES: GNAT family N-acetyltransferase [Streptomyces]|uniref:GNAT family N-acetyltransferase n=1 Tax=Streptomyces TaxID=1883 RepID=UPI00142057A6|nr:GNAT family N-acetyltransferase [Streptomyces sp. MBT27]
MSQSVSVRAATSADLPAVTALFRGYLDFYRVAVEDGSRPEQFLKERLENGDSLILLAETGTGPIGFAQIYPTFSSLSMGRVWTLNDLYVEASGRRCGAGRALVRSCVERARAAGAVGIHLETAHDNADAQALYEGEGFEPDAFAAYFLALG